MRSHSESTLAALELRPRHLLTLTVLRDSGGCTQQALAPHLLDRPHEPRRPAQRARDGSADRAPPLARGPPPAHRRGHPGRARDAWPRPSSRSPRSRTRCWPRSTRRAARGALPAARAGDRGPPGRPAVELLSASARFGGLRCRRREREGQRPRVGAGAQSVGRADRLPEGDGHRVVGDGRRPTGLRELDPQWLRKRERARWPSGRGRSASGTRRPPWRSPWPWSSPRNRAPRRA